jgi:hypothetical protein
MSCPRCKQIELPEGATVVFKGWAADIGTDGLLIEKSFRRVGESALHQAGRAITDAGRTPGQLPAGGVVQRIDLT